MLRPGEYRTTLDPKEYTQGRTPTVREFREMLDQLVEMGQGDSDVYIAPRGEPWPIKKISILDGPYPIVIE